MVSKTLPLLSLFFLAIVVALAGCAPAGQSTVWTARGVSFERYTVFNIQPLFNESGQPVREDVIASISALFREGFEENNLPIIKRPGDKTGVLNVEVALLVYGPTTGVQNYVRDWFAYGARKARIALRTRLVDKSTGQIVAEISTFKEASAGNPYPYFSEVQRLVNREAVEEAVDHVAEIMQGGSPQ